MKRWFSILIFFIVFIFLIIIVLFPIINTPISNLLSPYIPLINVHEDDVIVVEVSEKVDFKKNTFIANKISMFLKYLSSNDFYKLKNNFLKKFYTVKINETAKNENIFCDFKAQKHIFTCIECDLTEKNFDDINLNGAVLIKANLSGVDLNYKDLIGANLSEANLKNSDLRGANLTLANLKSTNLTDSHFSFAIICGANLANAKLINTNLQNSDLRYVNLTDADLTNANVQNLTLNEETIFCRTKWPSGKDSYTEDNSDC